MAPRIVEIKDRETGSVARILVSLGFNCFSWRPVLDDGPRELIWADAGFADGDKRPSSGGTPILFPFPGRIGGAVFNFEGNEYRLEPGDAFGNAIHGFVFNRPWRVVEQAPSAVVGEFRASVDDPSILQRWPADFLVRVAYEIRRRELRCHVRYENTGVGRLPCGLGTHTYFRLPLREGADVRDTVVTAPVQRFWELQQMIPTGRLLPIAAHQSLSAGLRLADHQFDTVFTGLRADSDGRVRTCLADPATGRTLTQAFDSGFTQCVIYTPGHRQAICLEPYTCVPDAIRLTAEGHETGLQVLEPGECRELSVGIEVT